MQYFAVLYKSSSFSENDINCVFNIENANHVRNIMDEKILIKIEIKMPWDIPKEYSG